MPFQLQPVFPKTITDSPFRLSDVLCVTFGALDHVDGVSGCAAYVTLYFTLFTCREKGVRCGSFFIKGTVLHRFLLQGKMPGS